MTKKEQALLESYRLLAALHPPTYPYPEPIVVTDGKLVVGWHQNAYSGNVDKGCTNGTYHSTWSTDHCTSQGRGTFYATKREAPMAMRWDLTRECMRKLLALDKRIEGCDE